MWILDVISRKIHVVDLLCHLLYDINIVRNEFVQIDCKFLFSQIIEVVSKCKIYLSKTSVKESNVNNYYFQHCSLYKTPCVVWF